LKLTQAEEVAHYFQLGLEWITKLEICCSKDQLRELMARLQVEAAHVPARDVAAYHALESLAKIVGVYLEEYDKP